VALVLSLPVFEMRPSIVWNFSLKTAAKPLQMKTWLLLTAYRKLPPPYPTVPSPTYRLATIPQNWHTTVPYDPSWSTKVNNFRVGLVWKGVCHCLLVTWALSLTVSEIWPLFRWISYSPSIQPSVRKCFPCTTYVTEILHARVSHACLIICAKFFPML